MDNKAFLIPYIKVDEIIQYSRRPAMSFETFKNMIGLNLLDLKKAGSSIIVNNESLFTLDFTKDWIIYNKKPYLTNLGLERLFYLEFICLEFLKRYSRFVYRLPIDKKLNDRLEYTLEQIEREKRQKEEKILYFEQLEKETDIHLTHIKRFIPKFSYNKKALANDQLAKATI